MSNISIPMSLSVFSGLARRDFIEKMGVDQKFNCFIKENNFRIDDLIRRIQSVVIISLMGSLKNEMIEVLKKPVTIVFSRSGVSESGLLCERDWAFPYEVEIAESDEDKQPLLKDIEIQPIGISQCREFKHLNEEERFSQALRTVAMFAEACVYRVLTRFSDDAVAMENLLRFAGGFKMRITRGCSPCCNWGESIYSFANIYSFRILTVGFVLSTSFSGGAADSPPPSPRRA